MNQLRVAGGVSVVIASIVGLVHAQSAPTDKPKFSGLWTFNADLSDKPEQPGFGAGTAGQGQGQRRGGGRRGGGGFGGRGGSGGYGGGYGGGQRPQDSTEDRQRIQELTDEIRNPSRTLLISQDDSSLTVTDDQGRARIFQTNGKKDVHQLGTGKVESKTKWDGNNLITEYDLGKGRKLRYTLSIVPSTKQLLEQVTFERDQGSRGSAAPIKRVYDADPSRPGANPGS